jgi:prevent-host-death family protein
MSETISISEAREKLAEFTARVQFAGDRFYIQKHGKTVAVLVSVEEAEFLDDMEDLALGEIVAERLKEHDPDRDTVPWDEVKAGTLG